MKLWGWPLVLGVLTLTGLIAGLVSEDTGDYMAWLGLGVPVAVASWCGLRRRKARGG